MRCTAGDLAQARNRILANDPELAAHIRKLVSARRKPSALRPRLACCGGSPHFTPARKAVDEKRSQIPVRHL